MKILKFDTKFNNQPISVNFSENDRAVIIKGANKINLIHEFEKVLTKDITGYCSNLDSNVGEEFNEAQGISSITYENGVTYLDNDKKVVKSTGKTPNIHCIRFIEESNELRSCTISTTSKNIESIAHNMVRYSVIIDNNKWVRLCTLVNKVIGYTFVKVENNELVFDYNTNTALTDKQKEMIYIIIAECFLTPEGFERVILLTNMEGYPKSVVIKLIETLTRIKDNNLVLCTYDLKISDITDNLSIKLLHI